MPIPCPHFSSRSCCTIGAFNLICDSKSGENNNRVKISFDNLEELVSSNDVKSISWVLNKPRITEIVNAELIRSCLKEYAPYTDSFSENPISNKFTNEALSSAIYKHTAQEKVPLLNELLKDLHRLIPGTIFIFRGLFSPGGPSTWREGKTDLHCINSILFNGERLEIQYDPEFVTTLSDYGQLSGKREFLVVAEIKTSGLLGVTALPLLIATLDLILCDPRPNPISNKEPGVDSAIIDYSGKNKDKLEARNQLWQTGINALKEKDKSIKTHAKLCEEYKKDHLSISLSASTIERNTSSPFLK